MELGEYRVNLNINLGIILVEHPSKSVSLTKLMSIKNNIEFTTKRPYKYGIVRRIPGYFFSYRLSDREVIVCGSFDKQDCIDRTKEFVENER